METIEKIGQLFYSIILPVLIASGFSYWMRVLQRRSGSTSTMNEFKTLFDEVQEERTQLKLNFEKLEVYKKECDQKIEEYRKYAATVMDSEMEKRRQLETENTALKKLVNTLTEKLALAQDQLKQTQEKLEAATARILVLEQKLALVEEVEIPENDETNME